jgi:hypothetical protein
MKIGTRVKLSAAAKRTQRCPAGREDNSTAHIQASLPSYGEGAVMLDRDLHGCKYWNTEDLVLA